MITNLVEQNLKEAIMVASTAPALVAPSLSSSSSPSLSSTSAWYAHADWCYRQGRKFVKNFIASGTGIQAISGSSGSGQSGPGGEGDAYLTVQEIEKVRTILNNCGVEQNLFESVMAKLHQNIFSKIADRASQYEEGGTGNSGENTIRSIFQSSKDEFSKRKDISQLFCSIIGISSENQEDPFIADEINSFVNFVADIRGRVLHYYKLALISYFKFLSLSTRAFSSPSSSSPSSTPSASPSPSSTEAPNENNITKATLRILLLLVEYGGSKIGKPENSTSDQPNSQTRLAVGNSQSTVTLDFDNVISNEFETSPVECWRNIVPQLFARLGHPNVFVRNQVMTLISRIGSAFPSLIVYPAVVGSTSSGENSVAVNNTSNSHFKLIVDKFMIQNHVLVTEVQSMIREFTRIAT